jgi:hypothetical protein
VRSDSFEKENVQRLAGYPVGGSFTHVLPLPLFKVRVYSCSTALAIIASMAGEGCKWRGSFRKIRTRRDFIKLIWRTSESYDVKTRNLNHHIQVVRRTTVKRKVEDSSLVSDDFSLCTLHTCNRGVVGTWEGIPGRSKNWEGFLSQGHTYETESTPSLCVCPISQS